MQIVHSVAELDLKIAESDRAEAISDDAMRAVLADFRMAVPLDLPKDPFSEAYRAAQMDLYARVAGGAYSVDREVTRFDVEAAARRPFPFYTGSSETAGEYFMAIGFVLKTMALAPGSRVLELGPGWGHTSLWLAQLGHHVTVVDIEADFCELIRRRAAMADVTIEVINDEFFCVERIERQFDAVLFYDSFHHCDDHLRLLRALKAVVAPGGRLFFGAEPITADFPAPWGLRLDGWALWGVRKNGWMELGFRDDYFAAALRHTGWFGRKIAVPAMNRLRVWEGVHLETASRRFEAADPRLQTKVGQRRDGAIVFDRAPRGMGLFGPYVDLPTGAYLARLVFSGAIAGRAELEITADGGQRRLARADLAGRCEIRFSSEVDLSGVEIRLICHRGFTGAIASVEIVPLAA